MKLKEFLASPLLLTKPKLGKDLILYLAVSEYAISLVIIVKEKEESKSSLLC